MTGNFLPCLVIKVMLFCITGSLTELMRLHYTDDMQYSLLSTNEGVALEKTYPNIIQKYPVTGIQQPRVPDGERPEHQIQF